jgi:hypothetical protein
MFVRWQILCGYFQAFNKESTTSLAVPMLASSFKAGRIGKNCFKRRVCKSVARPYLCGRSFSKLGGAFTQVRQESIPFGAVENRPHVLALAVQAAEVCQSLKVLYSTF